MACRSPSAGHTCSAGHTWATLVGAVAVCLAATAAHAQIVAAPPARGLSGETVASPGDAVVIYQVGLAGLINKAALIEIHLRLSPLDAPLQAGLDAGDIARLRLVQSRNNHFGDGNDEELSSLPGADLDLAGGVTVLSAAGNADPLGLLPTPVGAVYRFYFVVADLAPGATLGHAFRLAADAGHVRTTAGDVGQALDAANADRVVIGGLQPTPSLSLTLDVGAVDVGATGNADLTVTNDGAADLTVTSVTSSDPRVGAAPTSFTVAPGDARVVTVSFTPDAAGPLAATLTLQHNGTGGPAVVAVTGTGVAVGAADLSVAPAHLDFGGVPLGDSTSLALTVTNPAASPAVVTGISSDDPQFQATPSAFVVGAGAAQAVTVTYAPTGTGAAAATLTFTGLTAPAPVTLAGTGLNPGLFVSHSAVAFGNVTFGETGRRTLRLTNLSDAVIDVTGITADDPQFAASPASLTLAPGAIGEVELTFDATSLGTKRGVLAIAHDGAPDPVEVPLVGDATVALRDSRLDFGVVEPGTSVLLPVTIDNPSGAPVTITSVVSDNPRFVPARTTFDIPAFGSQTVQVAFTPQDDQRDIAHLSVTHNPTITITLIGNDRQFFAGVRDAAGRPLRTMDVPFGGEWLGGLLLCLYALRRRA